jgi:hypothetical protein
MNALPFARQTVVLAVLALVVLMAAGCPEPDPGDDVNPGDSGGDGLTAEQKLRADRLISVFENDTIELQYAYIEDIDDGRGYTAGRAGFTTATADLLVVVERYTSVAPGNELAAYLPRLRELAAEASPATDGLDGVPEAWAHAADDPRFRAAQDEVVDDQHGPGDDPDGLPAMIDRTVSRAGGSPTTGVDNLDTETSVGETSRGSLAIRAGPIDAFLEPAPWPAYA